MKKILTLFVLVLLFILVRDFVYAVSPTKYTSQNVLCLSFRDEDGNALAYSTQLTAQNVLNLVFNEATNALSCTIVGEFTISTITTLTTIYWLDGSTWTSTAINLGPVSIKYNETLFGVTVTTDTFFMLSRVYLGTDTTSGYIQQNDTHLCIGSNGGYFVAIGTCTVGTHVGEGDTLVLNLEAIANIYTQTIIARGDTNSKIIMTVPDDVKWEVGGWRWLWVDEGANDNLWFSPNQDITNWYINSAANRSSWTIAGLDLNGWLKASFLYGDLTNATNLPAAQVSAGPLGAGVICSSNAINSIGSENIIDGEVADADISDVAPGKISAGPTDADVVVSSLGVNSVGTTNVIADAIDSTKIGATTLDNDVIGTSVGVKAVDIEGINATGTPGSTTYLRGDKQWIAVTAGNLNRMIKQMARDFKAPNSPSNFASIGELQFEVLGTSVASIYFKLTNSGDNYVYTQDIMDLEWDDANFSAYSRIVTSDVADGSLWAHLIISTCQFRVSTTFESTTTVPTFGWEHDNTTVTWTGIGTGVGLQDGVDYWAMIKRIAGDSCVQTIYGKNLYFDIDVD